MSSSEQVTFLLACIKHSNVGKIDFDALGSELGLTRNAAYKRYKRLKERAQTTDFSSGTVPGKTSAGSDDGDAAATLPTPTGTPNAKRVRSVIPKTTSPKPAKANKRKRAPVPSEDAAYEGDEESRADVAGDNEGRAPRRKKAKLAQAAIEKEAAAEDEAELQARLAADRKIQQQILADVGDEPDDGLQDSSSVAAGEVAVLGKTDNAYDADSSDCAGTHLVAEKLDADHEDCQSAAQVKVKEPFTSMVFRAVKEETI